MEAKLIKKIIYTGTIETLTGLHIGGTNAQLNIGGPDNFVVRNPITQIPYIPGSSLKGKLRSLIEIACGETNGGRPSNSPDSKAGALFGVAGDSNNSHPSRIIIRDANLDITSADFSNTDLFYTEAKTEVVIDRITSSANPRTFERIPAGVKFNLSVILNIFEGENEDGLKETFQQAINLLHDDYLGGQGSRGYGQVKIEWSSIEEKKVEDYLK
ncbi:MAG: type III-A CRISPR-associated RAMP protein Csm3 [Paludibacteraceae bacterium]|nr:type III-A CRISPR-associated RAMP protein Csm3 [Paludibacteraceae bacterium]